MRPKKPKLFCLRRVVGGSMLPTLTPGTLVFAVALLPIRVGDIVVAWADGREVIKRVADIDAHSVELRGDNGAHSTDSRLYGRVERTRVYGKVIYVRANT